MSRKNCLIFPVIMVCSVGSAFAKACEVNLLFDAAGHGAGYSYMPLVRDDYASRFGTEPFIRVWEDGNGSPIIIGDFQLVGFGQNDALPFPTPDPEWEDVRPYIRLKFTSYQNKTSKIVKLSDGTELDTLQHPTDAYRRGFRFIINLRDYTVPYDTSTWMLEMVLLDSTMNESIPLEISEDAVPVLWQSKKSAVDSLMWVWDMGKYHDPVIASEMLERFPHDLIFLWVMFNEKRDAKDCDGLKEYGRRIEKTILNDLDPNQHPSSKNAEYSGPTWHESIRQGLKEVCGDTTLWDE